jgi:hypothetical protein
MRFHINSFDKEGITGVRAFALAFDWGCELAPFAILFTFWKWTGRWTVGRDK